MAELLNDLIEFLKLPPGFKRKTPLLGFRNQAYEADSRFFTTGDICLLTDKKGQTLRLLAGSFDSGRIRLQPLEKISAISGNAEITNPGRGAVLKVGADLKGKVLNCLGEVLNHPKATTAPEINLTLFRPPPNPLKRRPIKKPFITGVNSIDAFLTIGCGQRIGLFAEAGTGKSTLLGMLARNSQADINVLALVGERGREVREFIEDSLGVEGLKKSVIVCATSDETSAARRTAALTAISIAEHFRSSGKNVLFMMDSLTRLARSIREIGLNEGELPVRQGYTPSVFTELPEILERTGNDENGSITAVFTVLCNSEFDNDPLADEIKSLLDGHIILSRRYSESGILPAIDICRSVSRCFDRLHTTEHIKAVQKIRKLYSRAIKDRDVLLFGGEADSELKHALKIYDLINTLITQHQAPGISFENLKQRVRSIAINL